MSINVYKMKNYIELILAATIVVLLIEIPAFLQEMAQSSLGKILLLSSVAFLLCHFGKNAGILASVVVILILYKTKEGFIAGFTTPEINISLPSMSVGSPTDDASCLVKAKKDGTKMDKWDAEKKACVEGMSGHKVREGADEDPCNGATDNASCNKCSDGKLKFFKDGKCSATEGFNSKEVDTLKRLAAREGFSGYGGRQRYLKPYWNQLNTTDLDRDVKEKAERAKVAASKEDKPSKKQKNDIDNKAIQSKIKQKKE